MTQTQDFGLSRVSSLAFGHWHSQTLFALTRLGVPDALADGPVLMTDLADRVGADGDGLGRLLQAAAALGLVTLDGPAAANTALSNRLLTSSSPESMHHWVEVMADWAGPWTQLADAVRSGVRTSGRDAAGDADETSFILGMHEFARRSAPQVAAATALGSPRRLVDVGGGAGTYSCAFAEHYPTLQVELRDLDSVLEVSRTVVETSPAADRISLAPIDYRNDAFGSDLDVVLFSNVLHQESSETATDMLRRAWESLAPGGHVVIHSHFLDEDLTGPVFSTLHNLSALVLWGDGRSYTVGEMRDLVTSAGFTDPADALSVRGSTTRLLVAAKGAEHA